MLPIENKYIIQGNQQSQYSHIFHSCHIDILNYKEPLVHAGKPASSYHLHHMEGILDPLERHWMLLQQSTTNHKIKHTQF